MNGKKLTVPEAWQQLDVEAWRGPILLLGGPSTGKTTFGHYLLQRLLRNNRPIAYLDADVGQQELGLPATLTMNLVYNDIEEDGPSAKHQWVVFIGSNSPRGHFVPILTGLNRLQRQAVSVGALATVIDTSGFIETYHGAAVLKWGQIDLLKPKHIVACQRQRELESIIAPLRRLWATRLHDLPVHDQVRTRSPAERQAYRAQRFRTYFDGSPSIELSYRNLAVFPDRQFAPDQLVALEDQDGWAIALGLVADIDTEQQSLSLTTPWWGQGKVRSLRLGRLRIDRNSYHDEKI